MWQKSKTITAETAYPVGTPLWVHVGKPEARRGLNMYNMPIVTTGYRTNLIYPGGVWKEDGTINVRVEASMLELLPTFIEDEEIKLFHYDTFHQATPEEREMMMRLEHERKEKEEDVNL